MVYIIQTLLVNRSLVCGEGIMRVGRGVKVEVAGPPHAGFTGWGSRRRGEESGGVKRVGCIRG